MADNKENDEFAHIEIDLKTINTSNNNKAIRINNNNNKNCHIDSLDYDFL